MRYSLHICIADRHRYHLGFLAILPKPGSYRLAKRQEDHSGRILIGNIKGHCGTVSIHFISLRHRLHQRRISAIGKLPYSLSLLFQMMAQDLHICNSKLTNRINSQFVKGFLSRASNKNQVRHRQRPHLCWDFLREQGMDLIRFFKIRGHLCQIFV